MERRKTEGSGLHSSHFLSVRMRANLLNRVAQPRLSPDERVKANVRPHIERRLFMSVYRVSEYTLTLWSSRSTSDLGGRTAVASILLYEEGTGSYRGRAYFYADGTHLQQPDESTEGMITLRFNLCQFHPIMEMLRTEQPVYLYYYSPGNAGLKSGKEPVGEEEE